MGGARAGGWAWSHCCGHWLFHWSHVPCSIRVPSAGQLPGRALDCKPPQNDTDSNICPLGKVKARDQGNPRENHYHHGTGTSGAPHRTRCAAASRDMTIVHDTPGSAVARVHARDIFSRWPAGDLGTRALASHMHAFSEQLNRVGSAVHWALHSEPITQNFTRLLRDPAGCGAHGLLCLLLLGMMAAVGSAQPTAAAGEGGWCLPRAGAACRWRRRLPAPTAAPPPQQSFAARLLHPD